MINMRKAGFCYPDGNRALKDVSLDIQEGESLGLVGANGAGKSTLLSLCVGIHLPETGQVVIDGVSVGKNTLKEIRQRVGYVFQNPDDQLFMAKVFDDVAFGPRNYGYKEQAAVRMAEEALAAMGVSHLKERPSHKLSGGEKRRVAIAAVLAMKPKVLILDEPTSFLDPKGRRNVIRVLEELPHTKVIATHDLDLVLDTCSRVVVLKDGQVAAEGNPDTILTNKEIMENCGLELPLSMQGR